MFKNQLQEFAQKSSFNLPVYSCLREGPDHAPRFKATVNLNGEIFESPGYYNTLRQAEHAAAKAALNTLSERGLSQSLAAPILDKSSFCKNYLQDAAQKAGVSSPFYTTTRSGPAHLPVFTSTVELVGMSFTGEAAKTKKQAEKNAAMVAWSSLKLLLNQGKVTPLPSELEASEGQENMITRALAKAQGEEVEPPVIASKQQLQPTGNLLVQRTSTSSLSKTRIMPIYCESSIPITPGAMKQICPGKWLPGELGTEPLQYQTYSCLRNQPHSNVTVAGVPPVHSVNVNPGQISTPGSVQHPSGLSREVMAINCVPFGAVDVNPVVLTQLKGETLVTVKDRPDNPITTADHEQDEDQWLREHLSLTENVQETGHENLAANENLASSNTADNTAQSRPSDPWWAYHSSHSSFFLGDQTLSTEASPASPVRVRSVAAVCAAPPPGASSHKLDTEERVIGDPLGDNDTTSEVFSQLTI